MRDRGEVFPRCEKYSHNRLEVSIYRIEFPHSGMEVFLFQGFQELFPSLPHSFSDIIELFQIPPGSMIIGLCSDESVKGVSKLSNLLFDRGQSSSCFRRRDFWIKEFCKGIQCGFPFRKGSLKSDESFMKIMPISFCSFLFFLLPLFLRLFLRS